MAGNQAAAKPGEGGTDASATLDRAKVAAAPAADKLPAKAAASDRATAAAERLTLHEARERFERDLILRTLAEQQGNMSRTAEALGVERSNLYRKMRAFGITPSRRPEAEEEAV